MSGPLSLTATTKRRPPRRQARSGSTPDRTELRRIIRVLESERRAANQLIRDSDRAIAIGDNSGRAQILSPEDRAGLTALANVCDYVIDELKGVAG